MAQTTPSRRALVDLPVNTLGTPSSITNVGKASMGQKRQIQEVGEPEFPQSRSRVRTSPVRSHSSPKDKTPSRQVSLASPHRHWNSCSHDGPDSTSPVGSHSYLSICPIHTRGHYHGRASRRDGRGRFAEQLQGLCRILSHRL